MGIQRYISDLLYLIFPTVCPICLSPLLNNEHHICTKCLIQLPRTGFHNIKDNLVEKTFWGRVPIERASSFLFYEKKEITQQVLKLIKYKSATELAVYMGKLFGADLLASELQNVDVIVPVPLHHKKLRKRGYNQTQLLAQGIGELINKPVVTDFVYRVKESGSQTTHNRFDRWENVNDAFDLYPNKLLTQQHILLVDDVLTTGATLEAIAQKLVEHSNKVSIATLAFAANI